MTPSRGAEVVTEPAPKTAIPSPKIHSHPTAPMTRHAPSSPRPRDPPLTGAAARRERTARRPSAVMSAEMATTAKATSG